MTRHVFSHTARLGASALIVTLLTGWAWFDAIDQHRATGVLALTVKQPDLPQRAAERRPGLGWHPTWSPSSTGVAVNAAIVMSFSRPMVRASVERSLVIKPYVYGQLTWLDDLTLRFEPFLLARGVTYEVQVRGRSVRGVPLTGPVSWRFTTMSGPPLVLLPGPSAIRVPILMYHYIRVNRFRQVKNPTIAMRLWLNQVQLPAKPL